MEPMTVVIINDYSYVNGGASKVAIASAIALRKDNYNVILFSAIAPVFKELTKYGIKVIGICQYDLLNNPSKFSAFMQGIWNKKAEVEMIKLLKTLDIKNTIIHIHSWTKALSSSVVKAVVNYNFKVVLTLHDYFTVCPNGGFYNYKTDEICTLSPMSKKCLICNCDSRHYYYKIWRIIRQNKQMKIGLLPKSIKNYIYISQLSKNVLLPFLPKDAKYFYVKNPVDIEKDKLVDVANNNAFIFIGRLSKEKGCLLFAKAAKELNLNAIFVGDGILKDEILSIYPEAKILGWVNKDAIKIQLSNARALVFPSLWYETLGLTALEAQAKGVPVIVSDTCTAREVIKDKETGLWFKRGDLEDLKSKIVLLMDDSISKTYGENAYKNYWCNDYSVVSHVEQLEKVYASILNVD